MMQEAGICADLLTNFNVKKHHTDSKLFVPLAFRVLRALRGENDVTENTLAVCMLNKEEPLKELLAVKQDGNRAMVDDRNIHHGLELTGLDVAGIELPYLGNKRFELLSGDLGCFGV